VKAIPQSADRRLCTPGPLTTSRTVKQAMRDAVPHIEEISLRMAAGEKP